MALPVAKINAKPGPTELASEASTHFQAEIKHTQWTSEVMGWFTIGCINILFGHFYRKHTYSCYASQQNISDKQRMCWWPGATGICMCLDYFLKALFTWAVNIYSIFIQDQINIFCEINIKMQMFCSAFAVNSAGSTVHQKWKHLVQSDNNTRLGCCWLYQSDFVYSSRWCLCCSSCSWIHSPLIFLRDVQLSQAALLLFTLKPNARNSSCF